jgi:RNA polymerase sigma-70 factor, ECF subfamily
VTPAAADGSVVDLDQAFRQFAPLIASTALRILGRPDQVDDLVQDVFLDARRSLTKIRNPGAIRAWLMTATIRLARHRLRRRRLRGFLHLDELADYQQLADGGASPFHRALLASVYRQLDRLPVEQRIAWILRHVEGEELEQVALMCGCALATAKRRIASAHARIEEIFRHG